MYCPNCAKENSGTERFCRSCGLKLDFISRVADAEAAGLQKRTNGGDTSVDEAPYREVRRPRYSVPLYGFITFMLGTMVAFLGASVFDAKWLSTIGVMVVILGLAAIGIGQMSRRQTRPFELPKPDTSPLDELPAPPDRMISEPVPSVTEHTTKNLSNGSETLSEASR